MSGWVPFDADSWDEIVEVLDETGAPWPRAAALFDLRREADQVGRRTGERKLKHGRQYWCARWRWNDWKVRELLRSGQWQDPSLQPASSSPPAPLQPASSSPPAGARYNAGSSRKSSSSPPAPLQPASSSPPEVLHTRGDPPSPSPSPSPVREQGAPPPSAGTPTQAAPVHDPLPLELQAPQEPQESPADKVVAAWARKHRVPLKAVPAVVRAISAIRGRDVPPQRCATDAAHVAALQRATQTPWDELADEIALVARWAQESRDQLAARDIRAEGWDNGTDRSRHVSTLCVQGQWGSRLDAATRWAAGDTSQRPKGRGEHSSSRKPRPTTAEIIAADPSVLAGVFGDLEAP